MSCNMMCERCKCRPFDPQYRVKYGMNLCHPCVPEIECENNKNQMIHNLISMNSITGSIDSTKDELIDGLKSEQKALKEKLVYVQCLMHEQKSYYDSMIEQYEKQVQLLTEHSDLSSENVNDSNERSDNIISNDELDSLIEKGVEKIDSGNDIPESIMKGIEHIPLNDERNKIAKLVVQKFRKINTLKKEDRERIENDKFARLSQGKSVVKKKD